MKITYDKLSDSIYIYISNYNGVIKDTYSCNPIKIKQEFINFDISSDNKLVWIEVIKWTYLWRFTKNHWKFTTILNRIDNQLELIFSEEQYDHQYINNNVDYDGKDKFFWNISIKFDIDNNIIAFTFYNADDILDIANIKLTNDWDEISDK